MVLPGVPRTKRIKFVKNLIRLLLEDGLSGITEEEHTKLALMINELLGSTEIDKVESINEDESEETPGDC